ncbi:type II secretion system minor pseudopilin GspK [Variovorax sp. AFSI2.2]|uniref:type II secretion system minor pseudopilin GspK n=1 Tax=Variovorax sp. AFSI2.2 TaxID=3384160 RepID=UPI003EBB8D1C
MSTRATASMRHQQGVALVMALLLVAVVTVLASAILWRVDVWVTQVKMLRDARQAHRLVMGGVDWARSVVYERQRQRIRKDHLGEAWATRVPPIPVAGGEISGQMFDEQSKFNMAWLLSGDPYAWEQYERLLGALELPQALAVSLRSKLSGKASERVRYMGTASLEAIPGYTSEVIEKLGKYITLLPDTSSKLNVNTAPVELIYAIVPGLSFQQAKEIFDRRAASPFDYTPDFYTLLTGDVRDGFRTESISVRSDFFRVEVHATFGQGRASAVALLRRKPGTWPDVVWMKRP